VRPARSNDISDMTEMSERGDTPEADMLRPERGTRYVWDYGYLSVQGRVRLAERADGHRRQRLPQR